MRSSNNPKTRWLSAIVLVGVLFVLCKVSSILLAITTTSVAFVVFSKIEADQNVYDLGFWFTRYPKGFWLGWFRAFGKLESVVRSLLLGALAWFTFSGKTRLVRKGDQSHV